MQMSVQQMMAGMGENVRNARVTTSTGVKFKVCLQSHIVLSCCRLISTYVFQTNGSVNVHIDMDQPVQSEPRLRLVLAENLLRDINNVIQRMEVRVEQIVLGVKVEFYFVNNHQIIPASPFQSRPVDASSQTDSASAASAPPPPSSSSTTSTPSPSAQPMDTSPPPTTPPPPPTSSGQPEGPTPPAAPQ